MAQASSGIRGSSTSAAARSRGPRRRSALRVERVTEVAVGDDDPFGVIERSRDDPACGDTTHTPPRPKLSTPSGSASGKSPGTPRRNELGNAHDEHPGLDRDVAHRDDPALAVVRRRREPDLGAAFIDRPAGERHAVLPADESADPRPTGSSTTPRSSPAPMPWNTRSCMVGINLRCRCNTPSTPMSNIVLYSVPGRSSSRSFTPMATVTPRSAHAFETRSTSGPRTSTLDAHIRSQSSSHPLDQVAAAAAHPPLG